MRIDVSRERTHGWLIFGVVVVLCVGVLWYLYDAALWRDAPHSARSGDQSGPLTMSERIANQKKATSEMKLALKGMVERYGYRQTREFSVIADSELRSEMEPRFRFNSRLIDVTNKLRKISEFKQGIDWQEFLGFPNEGKVEDIKRVPDLLATLQLVERAALAAMNTQADQVYSIAFTHGAKQSSELGSLQVTVEEVPLTMKVRGSHKVLMEVLYRLTVTDADKQDVTYPDIPPYPLLLRGLHIDGENRNEKNSIEPMTAIFELVGLRFPQPEPGAVEEVDASATSTEPTDTTEGAPPAAPRGRARL